MTRRLSVASLLVVLVALAGAHAGPVRSQAARFSSAIARCCGDRWQVRGRPPVRAFALATSVTAALSSTSRASLLDRTPPHSLFQRPPPA